MIPLEKIVVLHRIPLFSGLKTEDLHTISTIALEEKHEENHVLFREGESGDRLFIVVSGIVQILKDQSDGTTICVASARENQFVGELAVFDEETRTATVRCETKCTFLVLQREDVERLALEYPTIALGFIKALSQKMRTLLAQQNLLRNEVKRLTLQNQK
jgi:CRP/FNR family transcriptional regulator